MTEENIRDAECFVGPSQDYPAWMSSQGAVIPLLEPAEVMVSLAQPGEGGAAFWDCNGAVWSLWDAAVVPRAFEGAAVMPCGAEIVGAGTGW